MTFEQWWGKYSRNDFRRSDEIALAAWTEATRNNRLLIDAARKIVRVRGNGQPKQLDDAVLLLEVALAECDKAQAPNVRGNAHLTAAQEVDDEQK